MNRTALNIAASTVIVAMTMVGCAAQSEAMRRLGSARAADSRTDRQAAQLHEQGRRAIEQGRLPQALVAMENAVALSPRDAGYRLLLADIYMKSGRFEAARATFADVVELDPSNARAGLSLALMHVALGRPQAAVAQLDQLQGRAAAADIGLAYALAGMPERGIEILEPEARGYGATPRLRQNLALSYALAGDWQRARAVAAQDVSPADLAARMQQWAAMASPDARSGQVASLLGVDPVQDSGQPVRLALAPTVPPPAADPEPAEAFAEAAPTFAPVYAEAAPSPVIAPDSAPVSDWGLPAEAEAPAAAPVALAEAELPPAEAPSYYLPETPAPVARNDSEVTYVAAAQSLNTPTPAVVRTAAAALPPAPAFRRRSASPEIRAGNSRFVVQLGAYSNEPNAERAWVEAQRRFSLGDHAPLTTTVAIGGRTLHRVSVAGFAGQADAARMCGAIRSRGGACFVRANAGDASVRWAARYARGGNRNA